MTKELQPRIVVLGVGGAGGNAVDNMIEAKLQGVEFVVANTDAQALSRSKADTKIQLGIETTEGLGAGARPEVGAAAAEETIDEITDVLEGAHMVFIAAGMGGGTGTGAAPVIARAAREKGILTVGVVTKPFGFEGARRMNSAEGGLAEIGQFVDTMIVVPNQNLFRVANESTTFADAFRMADDVLYAGVRGITDLMVMPGLINLDFADVRAVMSGMGTAMMGMGMGEGEGRALEAARTAIENPLLDDVTMRGAQAVLINITGGYDMTLFELDEAANEIRAEVDPGATIILGSTFDHDLEGQIRVSVVATGLEGKYTNVPQTNEAPVAAEPAPVAEERPRVISGTGSFGIGQSAEIDTRADFSGRPLPAAHQESQPGEDEITADLVFGRGPLVPMPDDEPHASNEDTAGTQAVSDDKPSPAGFSSLFGWTEEQTGQDNSSPSIVSTPDDHPQAADFDDEELEIPAFLRRSANH